MRTKIILSIILLTTILTASTVYAQSDWRTSCGINNPLDNLECAVDHLESEINIIIGGIVDLVAQDVIHTNAIDDLQDDVTLIDDRLTTAEGHIQVHHDGVEVQINTLQSLVDGLPIILAKIKTDNNGLPCGSTLSSFHNDWCPGGYARHFNIPDSDVTASSIVVIGLKGFTTDALGCTVNDITAGHFLIRCSSMPEGTELHYLVIN